MMRLILALCAGLLLSAPAPALAQGMGGMFPGPGTAHTAGAATTTWDASFVSNVTISGAGSLTATSTSSSGFPGTASVASHSTGKFYSEQVITETGVVFLSVGNRAAGIAGNPPGVFDSNGVFYRTDGLVGANGFSTVGTIQASATGDNVGVAVDLGATLIWIRTNGGNWNNSGTANPATGTGGLNYSAGLAAGPYYQWWNSGGNVGDASTANFGGSAYSFSAPAGFGNW